MSMPARRLQSKLSLDRLLEGLADAPALELAGISSDSRVLRPGYAFLACRGASNHGLDFLQQALAAGVAAVVWDSDTAPAAPCASGPAMVPVAGLDRWLGEIANRWFDTPSGHLQVSGVTGTNGKTTVAFLISQCMRRLQRSCAYLGTLGSGIERLEIGAGMTTPACIDLHRSLAQFREQGAAHAALEVSSHALHQNRIDGVRFDSAIFTNLSRDHIDYHGDMQAYGETKSALFIDRDIANRIVNIDSEFGRTLFARCGGAGGDTLVAVSTEPHAAAFGSAKAGHVFVTASDASSSGFAITIDSAWGRGGFRLPLAGRFNVANAALVLAQLLCWKVPLADALDVLSRVEAPAGRMQRVETGSTEHGPAVYVDYAHTPAGLEAALTSLRPHCTGNLWCVFGCGGDRDRGKRPLMGKTVARLADRPVVTSDNPRFEDPDRIIAAILEGMRRHDVAIPDRARAICWAINEARDNDVILIAGKGHETFQLVQGRRLPFSDFDVARANLIARRNRGDGSK